MKQRISILVLALAISALSCVKEEDRPGNGPKAGAEFVFTATTEAAQSSKTTVEDGEGTERIVKWAAGDQIGVWWSAEGHTIATAGEAGTSTTFTPAATPGAADYYYAAYPAGSATAFEDGVITIVIPATQDGTFEKANIAAAKTTALDRDFSFRNLTALVKFSVGSAACTRAVFRGAKGEPLAGAVPVTFEEGMPVLGEPTDPAPEVEVTLSGAGEYYISVLPCTLEGGFSISIYEDETAAPAAYLPVSLTLDRGTITNLGSLDGRSVAQYFVTPSGAGKKSGKSWGNAMGVSELRALLQQPVDEDGVQIDAEARNKASILDGVTIHLAEGDYYLAGEAGKQVKMEFTGYSKPVAVTLLGGYPAGLTGSSTSGRDTTAYRTAFTGNNEAGILLLGNQTDLTVEGITFKNASLSASGGALSATAGASGDSKLTLVSCRFIGNQNGDDYTGAGVYLSKVSATITDCYFGGNYARNGAGVNLGSGAGEVSISGCTFKGNETYNTSGALQNGGKKATVTACHFEANVAGSFGGGAFHTNGNGAETTFIGCTFLGNTCPKGGAISIQNGTVTCKDCTFSQNSATLYDSDTSTKPEGGNAGGAVIMQHANATLLLDHCTFSDNKATRGTGGAIAMNEAGALTIQGGTRFEGNSAGYHGGVISFTSGSISITDAVFHQNEAAQKGGVIYVASSGAKKLDVKNSVFTENICNTTADFGGGVLSTGQDANSNDATFDGCVFKKNSSNKQGGVIALQAYTLLKMNNCLLEENSAGSRGIIRYNVNTISYFNNVTFRRNYTREGTSWGICLHGGKNAVVCANNVTSVDNYATGSGNVVSFNGDGHILLTNCTLMDSAPLALVRANTSGNRIVLCNDILINTSSDPSKMFVMQSDGVFTSNGHNVLSCTSAPASPVALATSDKINVASLGDGAFFENLALNGSLYNAGYSWNGTLSNYTPATQAEVTATMINDFGVTATSRSTITNIGQDFYNWLTGLLPAGYTVDCRGYNRSGGTWWPGAYQGNAVAPPPMATCPKAEAGTVMKGETITVRVANIPSGTGVTVHFGSEAILNRTGAGDVSYAFENAGDKTITVSLSPDTGWSETFTLHVENLESIQRVAARLKADPLLCLVMAHRANSSDWTIPENSRLAIEKSITDKVDIVEMDLWTTRDGYLVVSHDKGLSRETNGSGNIPDKTLSQIKSLRLKDRNGNLTSQRMLTFDEYLDACKGRIYVNVDIGDREVSIPDVINAITSKGMQEQVLIYCNSVSKIAEAVYTYPESNVYTYVSHASSQVALAAPARHLFTQCGWAPTTPEASASGAVNPDEQPTSAEKVQMAVEAGTILTVNAIYTSHPTLLYPTTFPTAQVDDIFSVFPACQGLQVDTGAETRAALLARGRHLLQGN